MRLFARVLAIAVLMAATPHARAAADDDQVTAVSGVEVVVKPKVTPLEGVDVVVKRATKLSEVEVKQPPKCLPPHSPADQEVPAPKLLSTYPANGQTVRPGYIVLRLSFDLPMACRGSLPNDLLAACFSDGVQVWHESFDRRSLMIVCRLKSGTHYALGINRRIPEHFQGLSGREPEDGQLSFDTSDEAPVTTAEALLDRDPVLSAMMVAASNSGYAAPASQSKVAAKDGVTQMATVQVRQPAKCLSPRDPPDQEVPAPKLVSTFPAQGQTVRPGLLELRFTFDLPMACTGGVAARKGAPNPCSDEHMEEHYLQPWDRHTMRFRCKVEPGKSYVVLINSTVPGQNPWPKFQSLGGWSAEPYELTFTASDGPPVETADEADDEDPLIAGLSAGQQTDRQQ